MTETAAETVVYAGDARPETVVYAGDVRETCGELDDLGAGCYEEETRWR
jgi:hypothetical protein